ncbi:anthranilate synthase component 2 [Thermonema lapsum]|uniref:Anthranilate synthase component 2 n=1 Tax=Thermonema lapsum TaxID=28195 RepID=A0A846MRL2_9BACT|nr:aminodeoxychorismate/anthranilate synthase component II [Thermonema lapsum]NIK74298.1 anthranilate synthase component 2 [Thermonema lapsum]
MILIIDNYDSFTYNLVDYFARLGVNCHVVRNDVPPYEYLSRPFQGVVLSPGPGVPSRAGYLMEVIAQLYQHYPLLGICLGHQALAEFFGGTLTHAHCPMHGKTSLISHQASDLFENLPQPLSVVRYHSWVVQTLPPILLPTAYTADQYRELMAFRHQSLPVFGVQFHPEAALTQEGLKLLNNWLKHTGITKAY